MPKQAVQSFRSLCYVLPLIQKAAVIVGIDSSPRPTQSIEEDPIFPLLLQERAKAVEKTETKFLT